MSDSFTVTCLDCRKQRRHNSRGLCRPCWRRHSKNGTLNRFPPVRGNTDWQSTHRFAPIPSPNPTAAIEGSGPGHLRGAACRGHNPELFFPIGNAGPALTQVEQAKRICRGCPALEGCAAWVAANPQDDGIWAATTPAERRALTGASERTAA